jgi:hypothetical protein
MGEGATTFLASLTRASTMNVVPGGWLVGLVAARRYDHMYRPENSSTVRETRKQMFARAGQKYYPEDRITQACAQCACAGTPAARRGVAGGAVQLRACARCGEAYYCGKKCQAAHWKAGHSKTCMAKKKEGEEGA